MKDAAPSSDKERIEPSANGSPPDGAQATTSEQVLELTFPAPETPTPSLSKTAPGPPAKVHVGPLPYILVGLAVFVALLFCLVGYESFSAGAARGRAVRSTETAAAAAIVPLQVPQGARLISACTAQRGAQYELPQDAANGPVFNVYKGKVIGLEYIISKQDLNSNQSFVGLPLYNKRYDHLNIGATPGSPVTQYDIDLYNISSAALAAITCQ